MPGPVSDVRESRPTDDVVAVLWRLPYWCSARGFGVCTGVGLRQKKCITGVFAGGRGRAGGGGGGGGGGGAALSRGLCAYSRVGLLQKRLCQG